MSLMQMMHNMVAFTDPMMEATSARNTPNINGEILRICKLLIRSRFHTSEINFARVFTCGKMQTKHACLVIWHIKVLVIYYMGGCAMQNMTQALGVGDEKTLYVWGWVRKNGTFCKINWKWKVQHRMFDGRLELS